MIDEINALLPQTQCGKCGFSGCRPYAEAIDSGAADINQCPPGGDEGIRALADLLGVRPKPLNEKFGKHKAKSVAFIVEEDCIGCVKCINACPVDAIVGAARLMHTVIVAECTGCELCVPPCPVDCIIMQTPAAEHSGQPASPAFKSAQSQLAKQRYEYRTLRKEREHREKTERAKRQKEMLAAKLMSG
ncbi:MAG: RnfABCDGE type electron transport complex subunit B [Gammaproteobacteria bacterium]